MSATRNRTKVSASVSIDAAASHSSPSTQSVGDRPRERLEAAGTSALSDAELIALLLRTGGRRNDALAVASELLSRQGGLRRVSQANAAELARSPGIGPAKSASILAALEIGRRLERRRLVVGSAMRGPVDIFRHFQAELRDLRQERFVVVLLDARHRVMRTEIVSQGTLTASLVHPREVFRPALRDAAAALVLVHNHPSGDPTPSREDREVTIRLARAGEILGVRVLDHVVLAERGYCSLREEGLLPPATGPANAGDDSQLGLFGPAGSGAPPPASGARSPVEAASSEVASNAAASNAAKDAGGVGR